VWKLYRRTPSSSRARKKDKGFGGEGGGQRTRNPIDISTLEGDHSEGGVISLRVKAVRKGGGRVTGGGGGNI